MNVRCVKAMLLLDRSSSGLGGAERLALEAHLAECTRCSEKAALMRKLVDSAKSMDVALDPLTRSRVIREALRAAGPDEARRAPDQPKRTWPTVAAAAAAVVLLVGFWLLRDRLQKPPDAPVAQAVGAGSARPRSVVPPSNQTSKDDTATMNAPAGARLELGGARIAALTASELGWRSMVSTLDLRSGSVRVDVTPARGSTFRVRTKRFLVEVTGTSFEVDDDGVRVLHGHVRIVDSGDGRVLATLSEGQSWWLSVRAEPDASPTANVAAEINQARRDLAARQVASARSSLRRLLELPLAASQRAEVQSLLAECSLVEGDPAKAARLYAEVAEQHPGSLAGETAAFAQARAELRAGARDAARRSLERYVARYPKGRFSKEAVRQLDDLGRPHEKK